MRLGGGEYDPGGWCEIDARHAFLESAAEVAPHVLQDLKEKVLPEYISTAPSSWLSA